MSAIYVLLEELDCEGRIKSGNQSSPDRLLPHNSLTLATLEVQVVKIKSKDKEKARALHRPVLFRTQWLTTNLLGAISHTQNKEKPRVPQA